MTNLQKAQQFLVQHMRPNEKIQEQIHGLFANDAAKSVFKSATIMAATDERIYFCTYADAYFYMEEIPFDEVQSIYHRSRILSGKESILFVKDERLAVSHIEKGCPIRFMHFVNNKAKNTKNVI